MKPEPLSPSSSAYHHNNFYLNNNNSQGTAASYPVTSVNQSNYQGYRFINTRICFLVWVLIIIHFGCIIRPYLTARTYKICVLPTFLLVIDIWKKEMFHVDCGGDVSEWHRYHFQVAWSNTLKLYSVTKSILSKSERACTSIKVIICISSINTIAIFLIIAIFQITRNDSTFFRQHSEPYQTRKIPHIVSTTITFWLTWRIIGLLSLCCRAWLYYIIPMLVTCLIICWTFIGHFANTFEN